MRQHPDLDGGGVDIHGGPREIDLVHAFLEGEDAFLLDERRVRMGERDDHAGALGQGDEFDAGVGDRGGQQQGTEQQTQRCFHIFSDTEFRQRFPVIMHKPGLKASLARIYSSRNCRS